MKTPRRSGQAATPPVGSGASPDSLSTSGAVVFSIKSPPSLNVQKKWGIGQAKRFRDDLAFEMFQACPVRRTSHQRLILATDRPKKIVKFTRFWYVGKVGDKMVCVRELDGDDNLPGACKPVLDELKLVTWRRRVYGQMVDRPGLGLIYDDRAECCCAMYEQVRSAARAGELEIEVI